jgi:hypothetical protein
LPQNLAGARGVNFAKPKSRGLSEI